jgi:CBS domain-containing protein
MTRSPIETASPSKSIQDIAIQMKERDKGGIIIVDNDSKPNRDYYRKRHR